MIEALGDCTVNYAYSEEKAMNKQQNGYCDFVNNVTGFRVFNQGGVCA